MFGHEESVCKKKNVMRKEWRKVQRVQKDNTQGEEAWGKTRAVE